MPDVLLVIIGLVALYFGGGWLVQGASRIAVAFGISAIIIGLTIVAIGTSAPELLVSLSAANRGDAGIALGNVIGSNIANIGLILGLTGLIAPIAVSQTLVRREIPLMIFITIASCVLIVDGSISRFDGVILFSGFIAFNAFFYFLAQRQYKEHEAEEAAMEAELGHDIPDPGDDVRIPIELGRLIVGVIALAFGAEWLVEGASNIAAALGVPDIVIGVTMVAFGTSLPELAASLTAAFKGESDIAVGGIIGSNIANLLLVLGATAIVLPFEIMEGLTTFEFIVMIAFAILLLPFARNKVLSRLESGIFFVVYVAFILYSFLG